MPSVRPLNSAGSKSGSAATARTARQRAAGELRLEAQQIADEQRRIAADAARLDKGTSDRDAWRRLAGDKEQLADRVDDLQRAAEQLSGTSRGADQDSARQQTSRAARELNEQRIAGRMREGAKEMRDASAAPAPGGRGGKPAPKPGSAEAEQQIARALDRVIDQLNGADGTATDLSRALNETRAVRERLDKVERELREAEAKKPAQRGQGGTAGAGPQTGENAGTGDLQRLREQYAKELQRARETLSRLERSAPGAGRGARRQKRTNGA